MGDILMILTVIVFLLAGFFFVSRVTNYLRENENPKNSLKKKGKVHDLRSENSK